MGRKRKDSTNVYGSPLEKTIDAANKEKIAVVNGREVGDYREQMIKRAGDLLMKARGCIIKGRCACRTANVYCAVQHLVVSMEVQHLLIGTYHYSATVFGDVFSDGCDIKIQGVNVIGSPNLTDEEMFCTFKV